MEITRSRFSLGVEIQFIILAITNPLLIAQSASFLSLSVEISNRLCLLIDEDLHKTKIYEDDFRLRISNLTHAILLSMVFVCNLLVSFLLHFLGVTASTSYNVTTSLSSIRTSERRSVLTFQVPITNKLSIVFGLLTLC